MGSNKDRKLTNITGEDDDCMLDRGQFRGDLASSLMAFQMWVENVVNQAESVFSCSCWKARDCTS